MNGNAVKTPIAKSLNGFAERKVADAYQKLGKALPCVIVKVTGAIVTVRFDINSNYTLPQVRIPVSSPIYARWPLQVGDAGVVMPADAYLGGVSGLGGGVADLGITANLAALVFVPVSRSDWPAAPDPNSFLLQGPSGVTLRDLAGTCTMKLSASGIVITLGAQTITINAAGITCAVGNVTLTAFGVDLATHVHSGVTTGGANTAGPLG